MTTPSHMNKAWIILRWLLLVLLNVFALLMVLLGPLVYIVILALVAERPVDLPVVIHLCALLVWISGFALVRWGGKIQHRFEQRNPIALEIHTRIWAMLTVLFLAAFFAFLTLMSGMAWKNELAPDLLRTVSMVGMCLHGGITILLLVSVPLVLFRKPDQASRQEDKDQKNGSSE
jgi:hypothetical protein